MKLATLLIIALSNHGYWFGGDPATITVRPATKAMPAADMIWDLGLDGIRLGGGTATLAGDDKETVIRLIPPVVRTRVTLQLRYRIVAHDTKKEFETGALAVYLFPQGLIHDAAARVGDRRILVLDKSDGLPKALESAGVSFTRIPAVEKLAFAQADDIVMVGEDTLTHSPFDQAPLVDLAEAGASVMVFRQHQPSRLIGYALAQRAAPSDLVWRMDHPLLAGFEPQDVRSWIEDARSLLVVQLPPHEPTLEIGFCPGEVAGERPVAIDALLLSKTIGKGRIVLCQIPLGDWRTDPRSQMLLANAIDYLLTRPQPTHQPAVRPAQTRSEQTLSPGETP